MSVLTIVWVFWVICVHVFIVLWYCFFYIFFFSYLWIVLGLLQPSKNSIELNDDDDDNDNDDNNNNNNNNNNNKEIICNFLPTFRKKHSKYLQLYWTIFKGKIYKFIYLWERNDLLSRHFGNKLSLRSK